MAEQGEHGIGWCTTTWNPIRGCSRVNASCVNCYAERVAMRFCGPGLPYEGLIRLSKKYAKEGQPLGWSGDVRLVEEHLADPLRWRRPRRVFVNSMSDLFHEKLPDSTIDLVWDVMARSPTHTFQVLTKRPERMQAYSCARPLLPNVWLGTSVGNQAEAETFLPHLAYTRAAVLFISYEPAHGPVDFTSIADAKTGWLLDVLRGQYRTHGPNAVGMGRHGASPVGWVIVGGESGPGSRPFDLSWAGTTVRDCTLARVPVFVKQMGSRPVAIEGGVIGGGRERRLVPIDLRDRKGGTMSEWPEALRVQEFPR